MSAKKDSSRRKKFDKQKKLNELLEAIKEYHPEANLGAVRKAYQLACGAHEGQFRKNGEPYIVHPVRVAKTLIDLRLDDKTVVAALLHDVCEDTGVSNKEIKEKFGEEVAFLVKGVTNLAQIKFRPGREEYNIENLRKMFVAMAKDVRVILIKLADRLHNMKTLNVLDSKRQKEIAQETMEIYAPLAQRLGMGEMKGLLEDLAFPYLYPKEYAWVKIYSGPRYRELDEYLKRVMGVVEKGLKRAGIKAEVHARAKHLYSLYKKLLLHDKNLDEIYDLIALRIVVETIDECYTVLGLIHKMWTPLLALVKDYIALPKPNGYRSLHTTVFCLDGKIAEFQIRTRRMHDEAEDGIAAHWFYAEQKVRKKDEDEIRRGFRIPMDAYSWVKRLSSWQNEISDDSELLKALKIDAFTNRIFVFTPKGEVIDLPSGSTPIDFAYAIHTEVGNSCRGAKVNGKLVEFSHKLKNKDIVEIITSKKPSQPKKEWLSFVITTTARREIRRALRKKKVTS